MIKLVSLDTLASTQSSMIDFSFSDNNSLVTPKHSYKISSFLRNFLQEWAVSFEGCIAVLILSLAKEENLQNHHWGLINTDKGGIIIEPYTIILNEDHAEVVNPITQDNFAIRNEIEYLVSISVKGILERVGEAQPGYEGLAMISYVEDKTGLAKEDISKIITKKAFRAINPNNSALIKNL